MVAIACEYNIHELQMCCPSCSTPPTHKIILLDYGHQFNRCGCTWAFAFSESNDHHQSVAFHHTQQQLYNMNV